MATVVRSSKVGSHVLFILLAHKDKDEIIKKT